MAKNPAKSFKRMQEAAKGVDGDTLGTTLAFNGQCFLIQNMFDLSKNAERALNSVAGNQRNIELARAQVQAGTHRHHAAGWLPESGLKYVAPILSCTNIKPAQTYSRVVGTGFADKLLNLTTDKMAMLVPKLRIFKIEYEGREDKDGFLRPDYETGKDVELLFEDFVASDSIEKMFQMRGGRLGGSGIKSFKWSLKGVNPAEVDANITAELVIHFNDVADVFKDQYGKVTYKAGRAGKASFLDLIVHAPNKVIRRDPNSSASQAVDPHPQYMLYDGKFFEIKAEVGWQVPLKAGRGEIFTSEERDAIKESQIPLYMQLTKHQFDFNQDGSADLKINYRARYGYREEQFDLIGVSDATEATRVSEIEARISELEGEEGASDETQYEDELDRAEEELDSLLQNRYSKLLEQLVGNQSQGIPCKLLTTFASALQLRMLKGAQRGQSGDYMPDELSAMDLQTVMRHAREDNATGGRALTTQWAPGSVWNPFAGEKPGPPVQGEDIGIATRVSSEDFFVSLTGEAGQGSGRHLMPQFFAGTDVIPYNDFVAQHSNAPRAGEPLAADIGVGPGGLTRAQMEREHRGNDNLDAQQRILAGVESSRLGEERPAEFEREPPTLTSFRQLHGGASAGFPGSSNIGKMAVNFFLLGDLIDSVIEANKPRTGIPRGIAHEIAKQRLALTTLDLQFFNLKLFYYTAQNNTAWGTPAGRGSPIQFFKKIRYGELSFSKQDAERLYKPINIASLPIQYDFFMEWWMRKVVKPKRQKYYFNHFISDLLTDLVGPMLSARCFYGIPTRQAQLTQLDFITDKGGAFKQRLWPRRSTPRVAFVDDLISDRILPAKVTVRGTRPRNPGPDIHTNVRTIMMTTLGLTYLEGDYEKDTAGGIYHFKVGLDRGLLKEASFARADAPYLREARVNRDKFLGAEQLRELYNVTLRLYGSPLLKPGQYIYVTPAPLGFGNPAKKNSPARFLGIGGYHLVTEVNSTTGRDGYETTVKALHQAMPYADPHAANILATNWDIR
jgi:hypothetical protein